MTFESQLKQILPFDAFESKALGLLRGAAQAGTKLQLEMDGPAETGIGFNLRMMVGAFDEETGALNLEECLVLLLAFGPNTTVDNVVSNVRALLQQGLSPFAIFALQQLGTASGSICS